MILGIKSCNFFLFFSARDLRMSAISSSLLLAEGEGYEFDPLDPLFDDDDVEDEVEEWRKVVVGVVEEEGREVEEEEEVKRSGGGGIKVWAEEREGGIIEEERDSWTGTGETEKDTLLESGEGPIGGGVWREG